MNYYLYVLHLLPSFPLLIPSFDFHWFCLFLLQSTLIFSFSSFCWLCILNRGTHSPQSISQYSFSWWQWEGNTDCPQRIKEQQSLEYNSQSRPGKWQVAGELINPSWRAFLEEKTWKRVTLTTPPSSLMISQSYSWPQ